MASPEQRDRSPYRRPRAARATVTRVIAVALLGVLGCASDGVGGGPLPTDAVTRAAEIARLEARVERDRAALAGMVTSERDLENEPFNEDPELRAIAKRLTADTERLERLRAMTATGADAG